jgi:Leucine-rich repeat (LRR) protein
MIMTLFLHLRRLKNLYANGNKISSFEVSLASLASIKTINLANNDIAIIPVTISEAWGTYDATSGRLTQANTERNDATPAKEVEVIMLGNPIIVPATTDDTAAGSMQED